MQTNRIGFMQGRLSPKPAERIQSNKEVDTLIYISGSIIWSVERSNYAKSGMKKFIGSEIYKNMTARNSNTVKKLGELLQTNPPLQIKFSRKI
jgi:uncharacterized protein (DUF1697 family)